MRAAVITERGAIPVLRDFPEPAPIAGAVLIEIETAGLGGWDVLGAYRLGVEFPCVIRGEGVGRAEDGRRVYFGERSVLPFGAWAERTLVPAAEVWDVPDDIDDRTAITLGIAGTGALIPLEKAGIQPGDNVLVLGATGTLGQLGLQFAKRLGAGRVVAAARSEKALQLQRERGLADAIVPLGTDRDVDALKATSGEGFDVVLDLVCGQPMLNALKATRWGARIVTVGTGAGRVVNLDMADLLFRNLCVVGTGQRAPVDRCAIWNRILDMHRRQPFAIDYVEYSLDRAGEAWTAQQSGPHAKIVAQVK